MTDISGNISAILNGHVRGFSDVPTTATNLKAAYDRASEEEQKQFFQLLRSRFLAIPLSEPHSAGSITPNTHAVIIDAFAQFGPTAQLPGMVFGKLNTDSSLQTELWVRTISPDFQYSLFHNANRFPKGVLRDIQTQIGPALYQWKTGIPAAGNLQPSLMGEITAIATLIDRIEFERFTRTLRTVIPDTPALPEDLRSLLAQLSLDDAIAQAIETASIYVRGTGPFTEKIAGDLLRTAIDTTHRLIVAKLEEYNKQAYNGQDKDGARRAFMRQVGFITPAEERFSSAVYTLLSELASHQLNTPRETMLVIETTVNGYILLLLRRISDRTIQNTM